MTRNINENWFCPEVSTFGDRLSGAREQANLTQEQLAKRLGVNLSTLCKWEEDLSEPRGNRLSMLSGMLNVSFGWLLTGDGPSLSAPHEATAENDLLNEGIEELQQLRGTVLEMVGRMTALETHLREMRA
jgi:transcriptional regulator with XRE-family HTH domain